MQRSSSTWRVPCLALAVMVFGCPGVQARMYEWRNPGNESVQLSGTPPAWYRSDEGGPRIRVYENGKLVDDTAIVLPEAHTQALREAAFQELEDRQKLDALRRLEQAARRERARNEEAARRAAERAEEAALAARATTSTPAAAAGSDAPEALSEAEVARLKALIQDFDSRNAPAIGNASQ